MSSTVAPPTTAGADTILRRLGIDRVNSGACGADWIENPSGGELVSTSPIDGAELARVRMASEADYDRIVDQAYEAFLKWRLFPAPKRGQIVREIGDELRAAKDDLGALVTLEMGKLLAEGKGEVQEMIDVADFAVGLSRQLYGLTMPSERPGHRIQELWHPLGIAGVITAFNFPVAVWSWNAMIALACGDVVLWKPASATPLTAIAVQHIANRVLARHGWKGVCSLVIGSGSKVGERMLRDKRVPLVSCTGSTAVGVHVAQVVGERLGRTILELGGNNAIIAMDDCNVEMLVRAVLFGAVGTAGQRCTTTRRLLLQRGIANTVADTLVRAYQQVPIGNPLEEGVLMGPLVAEGSVTDMMRGLDLIREQGGQILTGGERLDLPGGCYVRPAIVRARRDMPIIREEIFAPILYLLEFDTLDEALAMHNDVPQGLSSAIFTNSVISAETFVSARGSDCGIANVNIGTSGAEIGGAFGGEKETGGGRESGSDAWKQYMRRQTVTVNWSTDLPLAQGIKFQL